MFGATLPDTLNRRHSKVNVAVELDASSPRIVEYLAKEHDPNINTIIFAVFEEGSQHLLMTDWMLEQQQVSERAKSKKKLPWSGLWCANVGEGASRSCEDIRRYGFLAVGGGGRFCSGRLDQFSIGEPLFAYPNQAANVDRGTVAQVTELARVFQVNGEPLLKQDLQQPLRCRLSGPQC